MSEKMTIHKALSELKTLEKRIMSAINDIDSVGIYQESKGLVNRVYKKEDFEKNAEATWQSASDLIERKIAIKKAIVAANAVTKVTIGGKEYTVSDAITMRTINEYKKQLANKLIQSWKTVVSKLNMENEAVEHKAQAALIALVGSEKAKASDSGSIDILKNYIKEHGWLLCDPLKVEEKVMAIKKEIDAFELDIDAILSESNATTFIEI